MLRAAFTMIELIFAIVIIGITVVSLPMMNQLTAKGMEADIAQEAVFATSAKMMQILSYPWDSNSTDLNSSRGRDYAKVIERGNNAYERRNLINRFVRDQNSTFRIGHVREGLHRRFFDINENIVPGVGIEDQNITQNVAGLDKDGYKFNMTITPTISFVNNDGLINPFAFNTVTSVNPTNIKMIELRTTANGQTVLLRAYASNIGEIDFNKRRY